jgi:predicted SAM-dependent methyltransferase
MKKSSIKKIIDRMITKKQKKIMLNVGCGTDYKDGWINIDNNSDNNIEHLDLNWDLRNPLPLEDNSIDFIFNEHFLEHLTVEEGQAAIKDFMRVLKPGGVLRIAMPDLAVSVDKYLNVSLEDDPVIKKFNMDFVKTRAERLNMAFRWWGHKWLYDWDELERRLRQAGFEKIVKCRHMKSKYLELNNLEIRDNSTLIAEATK